VIVTSRRRKRTARTSQYVLLALYMLFLAFPLLWMLSVSFKTPRELVELHPSFLPDSVSLSNYREALDTDRLVTSAVNSLKIALATSLLTTILGLPAAYVLARYKGLLSRLGTGWILLTQVFPLILVIIPLFLWLRRLHLTNTHTGLVLVYLVWALPFTLWMLQSYIRGIPTDLEEAAAVDGASRLRTLIHVIAPLLLPGVIVTVMFAFVLSWNEFFFALVLLQDPSLTTLPVTLAQFVGIEGIPRLGPLAAAALLATLPSLVFFGVMQRWLTGGLLSGAVKG
jgi:multiple sugar transport system permease protein